MDKHEITEEILRLIKQSIHDVRGSKAAFCRATGISKYNLSKILSGKKKFVFGDNWNRLCRYFPEIDNRSIQITGHCNAVNGSSVVVGDTSIEAVEAVDLDAIIARIMASDIPAEAKVTVFNIIQEFRGNGK